MPRYRFHVLPEDGLDDIEYRFADDFSALQTAEVVVRDQFRRQQRRGRTVIEVVRADGASIGFAGVPTALGTTPVSSNAV